MNSRPFLPIPYGLNIAWQSADQLNDYRAPSIIWQAVWNYIAGPYLLYRIRMIRDIYHWRLQTTLAIVAG